MRIYFDNAATTPLDKEVLNTMLPYMENMFGNPSAIHSYGRETRTAIEKARRIVAKCIGAEPGEIFFTSGGTESNNMALRCAVEATGIKHAITSPIEHHCVMHTMEELEKAGKVKLHLVKVDTKGRIDLSHLDELLTQIGEPTLVSLMHANNEIGTMMDLEKASAICQKHKAIFHSDTVQTMAHYRFDVKKIGLHFCSGAAHKFHGPKGVGFIYISNTVKISPLIFGGSQERNMRAGTENVYGIIGLAKAMELAYENLDTYAAQTTELKNYMKQKLRNVFADIIINGDEENSLYTVLNVGFPLTDNTSMLLFNLDVAGICASSGSACSSGSNKNSHVLESIHMDANKVAVRFSFSHFNTKAEVDFVVDKLKQWVPMAVTV